MDSKRIEALLDKYYNGETSLKEEEELKKFFADSNKPGHLKLEQLNFEFFRAAKKEKTEKEYFEKMVDKKRTKVIWLQPKFKFFSGIAAGILLLIGTYFFTQNKDFIKNQELYGTYNNPELAYLETKKALMLISKKLNKGTKDLDKLSKLNKVQILLTDKN